ncbi:MAG: hypothetical protein RLZZ301_456 [Bacteroidota bacterium]
MVKQLSIRILVLLVGVVVMNYLYTLFFFQKDLVKYSPEILEVWKQQKRADVLYFAESSNINVRDTDAVKLTISELTDQLVHKYHIGAINKPATHAGIYKKWIQKMDPTHLPEAIIVTMNLRSFGADWRHSDLESALQSSVVMLGPYPALANRFLLALNAFDNQTAAQREQEMLNEWATTTFNFPFNVPYPTVRTWDDALANGSFLKPDGSWDMEKITLACHYVKSYAFQMKPENPRLNDFDEIVAYCQARHIKLIFNLLAENTEYAQQYVGKELVQIMRYNRDFLVQRYGRQKGVTVVDNLELLNGLDYSDQNWTTEHYGYDGRLKIAKNIAKALH